MTVPVLITSQAICSACGCFLLQLFPIDAVARIQRAECRNPLCSQREVALLLPLTVVECEQAGGMA